MSDPFAAYGYRATSTAVQPLVGVHRTRSAAKARYSEIVAEMRECRSAPELESYLASISAETTQFRAELDFFWEGDGDFPGLQHEIERAQVRLDDGLDYPRHDPEQKQRKGLET